MSKTIVKSVLGVVYLEDKIVLTRRRDIPVWVFPGGGIDDGETPEEAIIREVKEETGFDAVIEKKIARYSSTSSFIHPVYLYKLKVIRKTQSSFDDKEVKGVKAFDRGSLPKDLVPFYKEWLEDMEKETEYYEKVVTSITPWYIVKTLLRHPLIVMRFFLMRLGLNFNT